MLPAVKSPSVADPGLNLDVRCVENVLTDYDYSQHLQTSDSTLSSLGNSKKFNMASSQVC